MLTWNGCRCIPLAVLSLCAPSQSARCQTADRPFRIGWYTSLTAADRLEEFREGGVDLVLPYWTQWHPNKLRPYLDEARRKGIKVLVEVSRGDTGRHRGDGDGEPKLGNIQAFVRAFRDHPAVYGWYTGDEPELHEHTTAERKAAIYRAIKAEDRGRPVTLVHWARAHEAYAAAYDMLMVDWYPRDTKGGDRDVGEFNWMVRHTGKIAEDAIAFARRHGKDGPVMVLKAFGMYPPSSRANNKPGSRVLTYGEYRYYTFVCVVQGVRDILFWMDSWSRFAGRDNGRTWVDRMVRQVRAIGAEMSRGVSNDPRVSVSQPVDRLLYRYGVHGDRHVLLTVNVTGQDVDGNVDPNTVGDRLKDVRFVLPEGVRPGRVTVLDEGRTIPVRDGSFADDFGRFEVHAYACTVGGAPGP